MRRRTYLLLTGSTVAGIAGCLGDVDGSETPTGTATPTATATPEPTPTAEPTESPTETPTPEGADDPESPTEAGERIVRDMAEGDFPQALERFRADGRRQLSAGRLEELWLAYTAVGGSFQEIIEAEEVVQGGFDGVDLTLGFEGGEHVFRVLVDAGSAYAVVGIFVNDEYERPDYVDTDAFTAEGASVETESCVMDATLTIPADADDGSVPGVVLVHGSDPPVVGGADKDLTTGGSKPFQNLAEGLSSRGVAVLRYDRRSHACPNSLAYAEWTLDAITVDDPLVAVDQLREAPAVDPDRVAVAGHSLGGLAAPRIAERDGNLAGIATLAAPARDFYEIFIEQFQHLATLGEYEWEAMATLHERWEERIDRIREGNYQDGDLVLDYPGALWRSVDEYDQVGTAKAVETPMFLLQGTRDYQVSVEEDFELWQEELTDSSETTFELYEGVNHAFQYGEGPSTRSEYSLSNPVHEAVVEDLAAWLDTL